ETTSSTRYDTLSVQVLNSAGTVLATLATYSNLDHNTGYTQRSFSLAGYAGQAVTVRFTGAEDFTAQTSFVLADTALPVSWGDPGGAHLPGQPSGPGVRRPAGTGEADRRRRALRRDGGHSHHRNRRGLPDPAAAGHLRAASGEPVRRGAAPAGTGHRRRDSRT